MKPPSEASPEGAAYLAPLELTAEGDRFSSAVTRLGPGPVAHLQLDRRGRLWASLPWSATVIRATPFP